MAPKKSAVFYFAMECKEKRNMKGSMKDVIEAIYPEWQGMTPNQKAPYERTAKEQREAEKFSGWASSSVSKSSSIVINSSAATVLGASAGSSDDPEQKKRANREQTRKDLMDLDALIKSRNGNGGKSVVDSSRSSVCGGDIDENQLELSTSQRFYFIKFVTFCRCDINDEGYNPYYVLGEVALVEYSLLEGLVDSYHAFIKPNKIPLGYLSKCMDSSRDNHHIPIDASKNAALVNGKTYAQIYREICEFAAKKDANNNWVRLFSMPEDIEETRFGLEYLYDQTLAEDKTATVKLSKLYMYVGDLECLVVGLSNNKITLMQSNELLTKYSYDYSPQTKCEFHEEEGVLCCALGVVKRKAYLISDHLCPIFGIEVTPTHLPLMKPTGTIVEDDYRDEFRFRCSRAARAAAREATEWERRDNNRNTRPTNTYEPITYDIRYPKSNEETTSSSSSRPNRSTSIADKFEQYSHVSTSTHITKTNTTLSLVDTVVSSQAKTATTAATAAAAANDDDNTSVTSGSQQQRGRLNGRAIRTTAGLRRVDEADADASKTKNNDDGDWYPVVRRHTPSPPPSSLYYAQTGVAKPLSSSNLDESIISNFSTLSTTTTATTSSRPMGRGLGRGRGLSNRS